MARCRILKREAPSNNIEKAYMMGLCATDISVKRLGKQIEILVGSTRQEILKVFEETFGRYGKINSTSTIDKRTGKLANYKYMLLHSSFKFLLFSKQNIPRNEIQLYAYIAGAIDGDGNIRFRNRISTGEGEIRIYNTDRNWLEKIKYELLKYGYHPTVHKSGAEYVLSIYRKRDIMKIGKELVKFMKNKTRKRKLLEMLSNIRIAKKEYKRGVVNIDLLLKYIEQGLSQRQIAEKFGVHRTTIKYWLRKLEIG